LIDFRNNDLDLPIIVSPNLGIPCFLKYGNIKKKRHYSFNLLVITKKIESSSILKTSLEEAIQIIPLKRLKIEKESKDNSLKNIAIRGIPIDLKIDKIENTDILPINRVAFLEDQYYLNPQDYLIKFKTFGNLNKFFKVYVSFAENSEVNTILKHQNFIMFDIVHKISDKLNRINYHSLVLTKQDWKNFTFVQATDIHLAKRNDLILEKLKTDISKRVSTKIRDLINELKKKEITPIENRLINPNNQLRKLIKIINKKVQKNQIDFLVFTGDIIDFCLISAIEKLEDMMDFNFPNTNWKIFRDIILNKIDYNKLGMITGEELLCPILTIPGNHDFRLGHYDLRWGFMYRKLGLVLSEAIMLYDEWVADPIRALTPLRKCLINYWQEINPALDYIITLGNNHFIFMNSGYDSGKDFRDFITGFPSSTGMTDAQIKLLENFLNYKFKGNENIFLFTHGPIINPIKKIKFIQKLKKKINADTFLNFKELKESNLAKKGIPEDKRNIDDKINLKYGTITNNWQEMINFCKDFCLLALCGHTHTLREFRLKNPIEKSKVFKSVPFNLIKIENPAAVFFDDYSELLKNQKDIWDKKPFLFQTPALGLGSYEHPTAGGAYREIKIKKGKIESFKVKFIPK